MLSAPASPPSGSSRAALRIALAPGPEAVGAARRALRGLRAELEEALLDDLVLLVSELVTNALRHGGRPGEPIGLEVRLGLDRVRVAVIDRGGRVGAIAPRAPDAARGSGWGLVLVERLADLWGVEAAPDPPGGSRVWFEMPR